VRPTPLVTEEAALEKKNLYMATKELWGILYYICQISQSAVTENRF
jgi:hypothetical protein